MGAGAASIGIADLCCLAMQQEGTPFHDARRRIWLVDSVGLVTSDRGSMASYKKPYAQSHAHSSDLVELINEIRPTCLIGASGRAGLFTPAVLRAMSAINERPVVFALSNPTAQTECTAEEAYEFTDGRVLFASGSPFDAVVGHERTVFTSQANNVYVFPGVGLGVSAAGASRVTDEMFLAAARALAALTDIEITDSGRLFPPLSRMQEISLTIAAAVAEVAYDQGVATVPRAPNLTEYLASIQFDPAY